LAYVGPGQGSYCQETNYRFIGYGGDFDVIRRRRDWTCWIALCCLPLLLLLPLLLWWLCQAPAFDCSADRDTYEFSWSSEKKYFCCESEGVGCPTTTPRQTAFPETTPTSPPTPPPTTPPTPPPSTTPNGPTPDPYNCAVDAEDQWEQEKKEWCCRIHHRGCPPTTQGPTTAPPVTTQPVTQPPPGPTAPPAPADPFNCADGFANWQAGWSVPKKQWCCEVHGKGCPDTGGGCATSSEPFDCDAGFANWLAGWSIPKKQWCCQNKGKGCQEAGGGCA
jgi:hypothetical protein